jgi:hypothetical protein
MYESEICEKLNRICESLDEQTVLLRQMAKQPGRMTRLLALIGAIATAFSLFSFIELLRQWFLLLRG